MRFTCAFIYLSSVIILNACSIDSEQGTDVKNTDVKNADIKNTEAKKIQDLKLYQFTKVDTQFLKRFSISQLGEPPASAGNRLADDRSAAQLGKSLFFDKSLSKDGNVSCTSCHQPRLYFTDGLKRSKAAGITRRSAPTVLGAAHSPWQFWDGRKDSLWSQALGPIEDANEYNTSRTEYVRKILQKYPDEYQLVFGDIKLDFIERLPEKASPAGDEESRVNWQALSKDTQSKINRVFSNAGKAMMAYQRQLKIPKARFDLFIDALVANQPDQLAEIFSAEEVQGLRLFVGKANCASCHNGPLFTNYEFHNIGAPDPKDQPVELGRHEGVKSLLSDEFTCLSEWSDANKNDCAEMRFLKTRGTELVGALKTPSLRNIAATAPYMQFGQFDNLKQVIAHYNQPTPPVYNREQHPSRPHFDIMPLKLSEQESLALESFLKTLTSPLPKDDPWWGL